MQKLIVILVAALAGIAAAEAAEGKATPPSPLDAKIAHIADRSACARIYWPGRGYAPKGYLRGIALTYAKAVCEADAGGDSAAAVMNKPFGPVSEDVLSSNFWGESGNSRLGHIRTAFAVAIGLGMRQSAGNPTAGRDRSKAGPTADAAEAGLFQLSYRSLSGNPWLEKLLEEYAANASLCQSAVFMKGSRDLRQKVVGAGAGADYQKRVKACPALATEQAVVLLRTGKSYFGPVEAHQVELRPECDMMLREVEMVLPCEQGRAPVEVPLPPEIAHRFDKQP
jgi:hypothetical protein